MEQKQKEALKEENPALYHIAFEKGTEAPFSKTLEPSKDGVYRCSVCKNPLFSSEAKFESGTGWPSFTDPINNDAVKYHEDTSLGMKRTEITCGNCGAHLGHVFDDGPKEMKGKPASGKRFCINCTSLSAKT